MPLIKDRPTRDWIDLAAALQTDLAQNNAYAEVVVFLKALKQRDCMDLNNLPRSIVVRLSEREIGYIMGLSVGLERGIKARELLRNYCEAQAVKDQRKEKKDARRAAREDDDIADEYR